MANYCSVCGFSVAPRDRACPQCGSRIVEPLFPPSATTPADKGARRRHWSWAWFIRGLVIFFVLPITAMFLYRLALPDLPEEQYLQAQIPVTFAGFVLGGLLTALLSAGKTILEPGVAAAVMAMGIGFFSVEPTLLPFIWILPFFCALIGAAIGEWLQGHARRRS